MVSLITDVDIPVPVPFRVSGPGAFFIAYDHLEHKVYWDETTPPMIRSAEISSTSSEIFINTDLRSVSGKRGREGEGEGEGREGAESER